MTWDNLLQDETISPQFNELHARLENYQIYSLLLCDFNRHEITYGYDYAVNNPFDPSQNKPASTSTQIFDDESFGTVKPVAVQSFDPQGKIPMDFGVLVSLYPLIAYNTTSFYSWSRGQIVAPHNSNFTTSTSGANYSHLIFGHEQDIRKVPSELVAVATSTRKIRVGYYRRNPMENNPYLLASLDWRWLELDVVKGKSYLLKIPEAVLGTLLSDIVTREEVLNGILSGFYPQRFLFADQLADLFLEWQQFYPPPPPPLDDHPVRSLSPLGAITPYANERPSISPGANDSIERIFSKTIFTYTPLVRVMAANNDRWGHGSVTQSQNEPTANHPAFAVDHQSLFESPQPDGSYGTYMTDSPRILEIWQALGAGVYAVDEAGMPRKINIGWGVMKLLEIMGLRRQPNGKFLTTTESKKYDRTRENSPKWKQGDYGINEWGEYGLAFKYLPTTYTNGQRQDDQYDIVHDFPQLLAAIVDQLDHSLNIQHGSEVRIPVGKDVQAYPNQGAATIDTAARIIQLERMVEQLMVMNIETSNSVRELFPGIGIPITTKAVKVDVGGQIRDIQYPGYQQSKPSLAESIGSLKNNLAIVLGALMPRKSPKKNPLNPWSKDK